MKLWKKIALALLVIILLVQIPFIYNRFQTGKLAGKISSLQESENKSCKSKLQGFKRRDSRSHIARRTQHGRF